MKTPFNKYGYIGFILFGIYMVVFRKDFGNAAIYFGIAPIFDPFDINQPWNERPTWQKAVLIINLAISAALLGYEIGFGSR